MKTEKSLKFCVNCKYYFDDFQDNYQYCNHPKNIDDSYNLVTGNRRRKIKNEFEKLRKRYYLCGEAGKWFEQKESSLD